MAMIHYLVINENADALLLPYRMRYQLFGKPEAAVKHAESIGFRNLWGTPVNMTPGVLSGYQAGDVKVSIIPLEVQ